MRSQVERNEQLNGRLMRYVEREDRLKEVVVELEHESRRVANLLGEQELKDQFNLNAIAQKDQLVGQLMESLEASNATIAELEGTLGSLER